MRHTFKFITGVCCIGIIMAGCSEWDDHYEDTSAQTLNSAATLWENISVLEAGQFSEFAALAKRAGYDTILTASQAYTLWAPVNGSISNFDELMQMNVDQLRTEFIENHIARNNYIASGAIDRTIIMLNKKVNHFFGDLAGYMLNNSPVIKPNIPGKNGVIHALNGQMPFLANIYESLDTLDERISDFSRLFHSFDHSQLNLAKSTPGPVIDGEITYLDSVSDKWNDLYDRFAAYINVEDSSYTMIVPTNRAYENAMTRIRQYYNYADNFTFRDNTSTNAQLKHETEVHIDGAYLHDSIVKRLMLRNLFVNNNIRDNRKLKSAANPLPDSLYTTTGTKLYKGDVDRLFENAQRQEQSNGATYVTDSIRLADWTMGWCPFIRVEAENGGMRANVFNGTAINQYSRFDSELYPGLIRASGSAYLEVVPLSQSNNPEVDFYLPDVRSTTYAVYAVFVPDMASGVARDSTEEGWGPWHYLNSSKPNRVRVQMGYNNADGTSVETWFGSSRGSTTFDSNPEKIDTVYFGDFTFPIAYAYTGYQPFIRIESRVTNNNFDRNLRIDCVLLIPKELDLYLKEHPEYELDGWGMKRNTYY